MSAKNGKPKIVGGAVFPSESHFGEPEEGSFGTPQTPRAARAAGLARVVAEQAVSMAEEMKKSGKFTEDGIREEVAERLPELRNKLKPAIGQLAYLEEDLEAARSKVRPFDPLQRDDAVGASRQAEIRSYLRGLEPAERTQIIMNAEKENDTEILRAVAEGASFLTGVMPQMRERIVAKLVAKNSAKELAEVERLEKQARLLEHSLGSAEAILNKLAGEPYDRRAFIEEMSDAEKAKIIEEFGSEAYLEATGAAADAQVAEIQAKGAS